MAMGKRQHRERQEDLWVAHTQLATAPGHPFYERLNAVLDAEDFDRFVESLCARFYAPQFGRPSLTPGIYFRSPLIGYFEGLGAKRGIAWRLADSLALRRFPPQLRGHCVGRIHAGSLDDLAHPAAD
jgi:transposase